MAVFFICIILIGSGIVLVSFCMMLAEKKRLHDYRTDLAEKKDGLIKVIEDAELLISEMNNFSDYVVTRIEEKNETLTKSISEADLRIEMLRSETEYVKKDELVYDEESVLRILEEEGRQQPAKAVQKNSRKSKVLTFDVKRREIIKLANQGLGCTEIARILNCGKGEIELISKMGR
ncbi:MAG: hypothetical protein GX957_07110 [Clostridiaceae bacterium]|nr:hypothetical protein [Clostridiaceae bacterium]